MVGYIIGVIRRHAEMRGRNYGAGVLLAPRTLIWPLSPASGLSSHYDTYPPEVLPYSRWPQRPIPEKEIE